MLDTEYRWDFNDSHVVTVVGYEQARRQSHSFALPAHYNITVLASNRQGSAFISLPITVVGTVGEGGVAVGVASAVSFPTYSQIHSPVCL